MAFEKIAGVRATVTVDMTNANADLTYIAKAYGTSGNSISVTHVDPAGNDQPLAVTVVDTDISVSLATDAIGTITSTAAEVKAAVDADPDASALVAVSVEGTGAGVVNAEAEKSLTGGVNTLPAMIRFYYETDDVFNSVSIRSSYRAKMVKDNEGASQLDDVAISQDERDIVLEILEQAIYDVFGEMFKITEDVTDPIFFNEEVILDAGGIITACGGLIKDNEAFNVNVLPNIDKKIENCLRYYIMAEWYVASSMGPDAELNFARYKDYLRQVKNLTFQLRKPLMT